MARLVEGSEWVAPGFDQQGLHQSPEHSEQLPQGQLQSLGGLRMKSEPLVDGSRNHSKIQHSWEF